MRPLSTITASASRVPLGIFAIIALLSGLATALDPNFCAEFNSAGSFGRNSSDLQSNGLCLDFCKSDYAYAITQEKGCWCSNYTPAKSTVTDLSSCTQDCPGYPFEKCGGKDVFSYVEISGQTPAGTKGPGSGGSDPPKDDDESSTNSPEESTTTKKSKPTTAENPVIQTVTAGGTVRTVTVMPTSGPSDGANSDNQDGSDNGGSGGGLNTGAVVGIVIGIIAAVLVAAGLAIFWFLKKRKQEKEHGYEEDPSVRGSSPGVVGSHRPDMSMTGGSPNSPTSTSNRNSTLMVDPRMDPFKQGLYARSGSHESVNTLRDDHDYSRRIQHPKVLRATNPDPDT